MFWLYTQQLACDAGSKGCYVNVSVHPEDRFAAQYDPGKPQDSVVIVGIDSPCQQPLANVVLASPDLLLDRDGVVRRMPLTVQPLCYDRHTCTTPVIDTLGAAAYRLGQFGGDFQSAPDVQVAKGAATFGTAWSTPVDPSGAVLVNFSGPPGNFESYGHYVSLSKVL